jgi:hypothetical protein
MKENSWIKVNLPLGPIYDYSNETEIVEKESMDKKLKPGMLLKLKNKKIILVGDINKNGGICDDCHYGQETIVTHYKQIDIKKLV